MTDHYGFTMASLNENGSVFANPCKGEKNMSTLMYRPFRSWANNSEVRAVALKRKNSFLTSMHCSGHTHAGLVNVNIGAFDVTFHKVMGFFFWGTCYCELSGTCGLKVKK